MEKCILTHKANLIQVYGKEGFEKIHKAMGELAKVSRAETEIVFIDEAASVKAHKIDPVKESNPEKIQKAIETLCKQYDTEYLLLVGGNRIIPFHQLKDPTNPNEIVYSDAPYADIYFDDLRSPDISMGRMPDGGVKDPTLLLNQLQTAINYFKGVVKETVDTTGVSAKSWEKVSMRLYDKLKGETELILTPEYGLGTNVPEHINLAILRPEKWQYERPDSVTKAVIEHVSSLIKHKIDPQLLTGRKLLYFNIHGDDRVDPWMGDMMTSKKIEGEECIMIVYPDIVKPWVIKEAKVTNAIVFTEACYGAYTIDKTPETSNALCFLNQGVLCLVGSTAVAYGEPRKQYPRWADVLAKYFFDFIKRKYEVGTAFQMAKQRYVGTERPFNREDLKTMFEFLLLGDPSVAML